MLLRETVAVYCENHKEHTEYVNYSIGFKGTLKPFQMEFTLNGEMSSSVKRKNKRKLSLAKI
jgi:hypothetical protein